MLRTFERSESLEEVAQVVDGRVAENLGRAVLVGAGDPLGQVRHQPGELVEERLLGELDRFLEPRLDALLLLLVEARREPEQVVGRLDVRIVPADTEEADQRRRVIGRVEERAEALSRGLLQLVEVLVQRPRRRRPARP